MLRHTTLPIELAVDANLGLLQKKHTHIGISTNASN